MKYSLKKIYNIYVKIAQAHFIYQPSKPKAIIAMPFNWLEVQNLLEDYLEKHGADFDALSKEYISESAEDDYLPPAEPENDWIPVTKKAHPDLPIRVQVQMDNGWIITAYYQDGEWLSVPDCGEPIQDKWIEAWRELPELYEERRKE